MICVFVVHISRKHIYQLQVAGQCNAEGGGDKDGGRGTSGGMEQEEKRRERGEEGKWPTFTNGTHFVISLVPRETPYVWVVLSPQDLRGVRLPTLGPGGYVCQLLGATQCWRTFLFRKIFVHMKFLMFLHMSVGLPRPLRTAFKHLRQQTSPMRLH